MWDIIPSSELKNDSFSLRINCKNFIVSRIVHANLYNVMSGFRCEKTQIVNMDDKGKLSNELKRLIITKLETYVKYNCCPLYFDLLDSLYYPSFSHDINTTWLNENICCGSVIMRINSKWIPEYKLENDYMKKKYFKTWDYHYECNDLPWKSRCLNSVFRNDKN